MFKRLAWLLMAAFLLQGGLATAAGAHDTKTQKLVASAPLLAPVDTSTSILRSEGPLEPAEKVEDQSETHALVFSDTSPAGSESSSEASSEIAKEEPSNE